MNIAEQLKNIWAKYGTELAAIFIASMVLQTDYSLTPGVQLDGSWVRALNMALHNGLVFGKDFVFTYGPLGFIDTRNTEYLPKIILLFFDLFTLLGYYSIFKDVIKREKGMILFLFLSMIFIRLSFFSFAAKLFIIYIFFIIRSYKNDFKSYADLLYMALTSCILFFDKVNYGLFAVAMLGVPLVICVLKNRKGLLVLLPAFFISFFIVLSIFKVDLAGYLRYSAIVIANYNDAMFIHIEPNNKFVVLALTDIGFVLAVIVVLWNKVNSVLEYIEFALIAGLALLFAFLDFKNGFVRADYHIVFFFYFFPVFLCLLTWYTGLFGKRYFKWQMQASLVITLVAFFAFQFDNINLHKYALKIIFPYAISMFSSSDPSKTDSEVIHLPQNIKTEIGKQSVDIFPYDISVIQLNELNYHPRPIPQSYVAFAKTFDSLNASFMESKNRPEYLILDTKTIDNRYPFWDEGLTTATVRLNYHYAGSFGWQQGKQIKAASEGNKEATSDTVNNEGYLLLKANNAGSVGNKPVFEKIDEFILEFGETKQLHLSDSAPVYMMAETGYTLGGKAAKIFFQPPPMNVELGFEGNTKEIFRCVYSLLNTPLLINKAILDNMDMRNFFSGKLKKSKNITSLRFIKESGWQKEIKVSLYRMVNY